MLRKQHLESIEIKRKAMGEQAKLRLDAMEANRKEDAVKKNEVNQKKLELRAVIDNDI